jgi:hypothetical protein
MVYNGLAIIFTETIEMKIGKEFTEERSSIFELIQQGSFSDGQLYQQINTLSPRNCVVIYLILVHFSKLK